MCWITLSPSHKKKHKHHHDHPSDHGSSADELVRVTRTGDRRRYSRVTIKAPSIVLDEERHHHHHDYHPLHPHSHHHHHENRHHYIHPLHMHPLHGHHHHFREIKLSGPGRKRCPPPPPPPPSRISSCHPGSSSREPIYRTQIIEPHAVRETTRVALREVRPERERGRLRRVAGYEVLGREVPWSWDCISSVADSVTTKAKGGRKGRSIRVGGRNGLRFPPFGEMENWM